MSLTELMNQVWPVVGEWLNLRSLRERNVTESRNWKRSVLVSVEALVVKKKGNAFSRDRDWNWKRIMVVMRVVNRRMGESLG